MPQDKLQAAESKFYNKENYARVPFRTYSGDVRDSECVTEVWVIEKSQTHESVTIFWAVVNFHLCKILDLFQHHPRAQYMNTNQIRLGFKTEANTQIFIAKGLPHLKDLGYAFKTGCLLGPPGHLVLLSQCPFLRFVVHQGN